jgi:hypothetical protein
MKSALNQKAYSDSGDGNRKFSYWALWWGISFGFAFLTAAVIGFLLSGAPYVDKGGQAESILHHRSKALGIVVAAFAGTLAVVATASRHT